MQNQKELPQNYKELYQIDLQKDKKLAVLVNVVAIVIAVVMVVAANRVVSVLTLFDLSDGIKVFLIRMVINISGAAGDFYVTYKFSRLPADILVQDVGVSMTVFVNGYE